MANDGRKHMRLAIPAADYEKFKASKARVEDAGKVVMTDPQYAVQLIKWALRDD